MRLKGIWILFAIALGGLALATAGCGGGGSTTTVTVDSSTEATATESTDTTTEETTTEETDTTEAETDSSDTETNALGFATSENCQEFLKLSQSISTAMSGSGDTDIQQAADAMQKFADEAPEDIKDDFQTLADTYSKIADALDGADLSSGSTPSAEVIAALANLSRDIDQAKLTVASSNIATWVTQNCTGG